MQSHDFKCNLYANNFPIFIFILSLSLKIQAHLYRLGQK